jgi:hypothetical protein
MSVTAVPQADHEKLDESSKKVGGWCDRTEWHSLGGAIADPTLEDAARLHLPIAIGDRQHISDSLK